MISALSVRRQIEVSQNPFGQPGDIFEEHRLALTVRAHHQIVKAERKLNDRIETGKRAVARPHLLDHYPAVTGAEKMHHPPGEDGLRKPFGCSFDRRRLLRNMIEQHAATL